MGSCAFAHGGGLVTVHGGGTARLCARLWCWANGAFVETASVTWPTGHARPSGHGGATGSVTGESVVDSRTGLSVPIVVHASADGLVVYQVLFARRRCMKIGVVPQTPSSTVHLLDGPLVCWVEADHLVSLSPRHRQPAEIVRTSVPSGRLIGTVEPGILPAAHAICVARTDAAWEWRGVPLATADGHGDCACEATLGLSTRYAAIATCCAIARDSEAVWAHIGTSRQQIVHIRSGSLVRITALAAAPQRLLCATLPGVGEVMLAITADGAFRVADLVSGAEVGAWVGWRGVAVDDFVRAGYPKILLLAESEPDTAALQYTLTCATYTVGSRLTKDGRPQRLGGSGGSEAGAGGAATLGAPRSALSALQASVEARVVDVQSSLRRAQKRIAQREALKNHAASLLHGLLGQPSARESAGTGARLPGLLPLWPAPVGQASADGKAGKRARTGMAAAPLAADSCASATISVAVESVAVSLQSTRIHADVVMRNTARAAALTGVSVAMVAGARAGARQWVLAPAASTMAASVRAGHSVRLRASASLPLLVTWGPMRIDVVLLCDGQARLLRRVELDPAAALRSAIHTRGDSLRACAPVVCALRVSPRGLGTALHARALAQLGEAVGQSMGLAGGRSQAGTVTVHGGPSLQLCCAVQGGHAVVVLAAATPQLLALAVHAVKAAVPGILQVTPHTLTGGRVQALREMHRAVTQEYWALEALRPDSGLRRETDRAAALWFAGQHMA